LDRAVIYEANEWFRVGRYPPSVGKVPGKYPSFFYYLKNRIFVGYMSDTYPTVSEKYPYPIRYPTRVREFCEVSAFHSCSVPIA